MSGFRSLTIYQEAYSLAIKVHKLTLRLPSYEMYEQGRQVRRSSKSVKDCIAEGYGRKRYKADYTRFLIYSLASADEAVAQLTMIEELHFQAGDLTDLIWSYRSLNRKIDSLIRKVEMG